MITPPGARRVAIGDLSSDDILIGQDGGRSAVYESWASSAIPGCIVVETEHGPLYLERGAILTVVDRP